MEEGEDIYVENPTFRSAYPMEPLHYGKRLRWDFKVHLIGEKVVDPLIHTCEVCIQPILSYGRMIPCKHAFCLDCAKGAGKRCPRCKESVTRVEQSPLGSVFICTIGGQKQLANGCRRTYLSQRDLNSHVAHRHLQNLKTSPGDASKSGVRNQVTDPGATPRPVEQQQVFNNPAAAGLLQSVNALLGHLTPQMVPPPIRNPVPQQAMPRLPIVPQPIASTTIESYQTSSIPVMSTSRTNLITVPIQEEQYRHPGSFPTPISGVPGPFPGQVNPHAPLQPYISSAQVSSSQYPPQISMASAHYTTSSGVPHPISHHGPPPQIVGGQNQPRFSSPHQPFDDKHSAPFNQQGESPRMPWTSGTRPPAPGPPQRDGSSYQYY